MSWQPALLWPSHIYRNQLQEIKSLGWLLSFYAFTDLAVTMEAKIRCSKPEPFFFFFGLCTDSSADALIAAMHKNPGPAQGL